MNISQLQYLLSAASLGSFTKAAEAHHMTVPTISQAIRQLEDEMGAVIFHRTKKGVTPTKEGALILQHSAAMLKNLEQMQNRLASLKEEQVDSLTISAIPVFVPQVVQVMLELMQKYPTLKVQMIEGDTQTVLKQVQEGSSDLGLIAYSISQQDAAFDWVPIVEGNAVLIMNTSSPLRFYRTISPDDLENEVFVLYKDEHIGKIARNLMAAHPTNRIALVTNNTETLCQMVVKGDAVTIAPDFIMNALPQIYREHIVSVPLQQLSHDKAILGIITRSGGQVPKITEAFTAKLKELVNSESPAQ
ncbi:LysR family transcriptional regulator [Paenibacillus piscarius]|uniref:LysR family transcriptional regulator n=1 Tax=Paenibacillus piscarius TaxID=1089681 RepID=UPI001EE9AE1F|nr:LysR family transcriptional regulator [Paenibacillus piscarius]